MNTLEEGDAFPLVTVLITNYNYARYLREAIESVLRQTYPKVEVVVVDDGSTDESRSILIEYKGRIKLVLKPNGGQHSAWNAGFAVSNGKIICFLDSDDVFEENKIERIVKTYAQQKDISWCFHRLRYVDLLKKKAMGVMGESKSMEVDFTVKIRKRRFACPFLPAASGLTFRSEFFSQIYPLPETQKHSGDFYVKFMSLALSRGYLLSEVLAVNRIHAGNEGSFLSLKKGASVRARELVNTAVLIRTKHEELKSLCNTLFAGAVGRLWYAKPKSIGFADLMQSYWGKTNGFERFWIYSKAIKPYFTLKTLDENKSLEEQSRFFKILKTVLLVSVMGQGIMKVFLPI